MQTLELRIPPLALVLIFAGFMAMLAYFVPFAIPVPFAGVLSIIIAAAGAAVAVAGVSAFRKHKTTVNPFTPEQSSALVASGIYSYTRNPMYLGFLLALIGLGVYLSNLPSLVLATRFLRRSFSFDAHTLSWMAWNHLRCL